MIRVTDLFDELIHATCRSCNSKAIHDQSGIHVELDCHAVVNCQFIVVATSTDGNIIFNSRVSLNDMLDFTLQTTITCYDPCDKSFYNDCEPGLYETNHYK